MNPFKSSLYWRLLGWFCAANLLVLLVGGFLAQRFIEYSTAVEIDWSSLAQSANQQYEAGGAPALQRWTMDQRHEGIDATLFERGRPLLPMHLPRFLDIPIPSLLESGQNVVMQPRPGVYLAVQQVTGDDGQLRQLVALSRTHTRLRRETQAQILLVIQAGLSLLFIALIGWWVARSVARPVGALRDATRRMAAGELSTRVGGSGATEHDELGQLARDFDTMAERIEALVAHERGVLQDLSHELRSPLARLQLILDLAHRSRDPEKTDAYFLQAETEISRLDRMTGEMLALSRMEGALPGMQAEILDLAEVARECLAQAAIEARARGIELQWLAPADAVWVSGDALLLERACSNLLANAIKFSADDGSVWVQVRRVEAEAELSVGDRGPGVPEAELEALFRPFFRGSNAARAEGHGLGLAIVQRVVSVHRGTISAHNREGGGLEVRLRLPLASDGIHAQNQ
jgi:two-component system OmpR family sensor kinase